MNLDPKNNEKLHAKLLHFYLMFSFIFGNLNNKDFLPCRRSNFAPLIVGNRSTAAVRITAMLRAMTADPIMNVTVK